MSDRSIPSSCECSRNTVASTLKRAKECNLSCTLPNGMTDTGLIQALFPKQNIASSRRMPNYEHVHKELAKSNITFSLLWNEYIHNHPSKIKTMWMC